MIVVGWKQRTTVSSPPPSTTSQPPPTTPTPAPSTTPISSNYAPPPSSSIPPVSTIPPAPSVSYSAPPWISSALEANIESLESVIAQKLSEAYKDAIDNLIESGKLDQISTQAYLINSGIEPTFYPQLVSLMTFGRLLHLYIKKKHYENDQEYADYTNFLDFLAKKNYLKIYFNNELVTDYTVKCPNSNGTCFAISLNNGGLSFWMFNNSYPVKIESPFPFYYYFSELGDLDDFASSKTLIIIANDHTHQSYEDRLPVEGFVSGSNPNTLTIERGGTTGTTNIRFFIAPFVLDESFVSAQSQAPQTQTEEGEQP